MLWQGEMIDFKLFGGFGFGQKDGETDPLSYYHFDYLPRVSIRQCSVIPSRSHVHDTIFSAGITFLTSQNLFSQEPWDHIQGY